MSEPVINLESKENVGLITFNRPEVFNAFDERMTGELTAALKAVEKNVAVRAVVITGAGKAFCSGQDLKNLEAGYRSGTAPLLGGRLRQGYNPIIQKMRSMEKPIIAAINGVAAGAGASLALAADLRTMASGAALIEVFINVGLVPDSGSTFFLPRLVGLSRAMEMCITGDKMTADEALRLGLVNRVYPLDTLLEETMKWARQLANLPTRAIGLTKRLLNQSLDQPLEAQLEAEAFLQETAGQTADHLEGVQAFLEKRPAKFQGR
ncbi:MAG: 1,2-epoxyphenylacetyl-CoA isomerase [Phycisphaerae bacterium]|nr:1,2-epoxyphenylacetyl-CoA isomerase [Phycisphaerae bacterium]